MTITMPGLYNFLFKFSVDGHQKEPGTLYFSNLHYEGERGLGARLSF